MVDIQFGPLGGSMIYLLAGLIIVGAVFAPTLGGAIVWGLAALALVAVLFFVLRRFYLVLTGRRTLGRGKK